LLALFAATIMVSVAGVLAAFALRPFLRVGFYDANFELFRNTLSTEQGTSLLASAEAAFTSPVLILLLLTNLVWLGTATVLYRRASTRESSH
jgi:hypothetical protein